MKRPELGVMVRKNRDQWVIFLAGAAGKAVGFMAGLAAAAYLARAIMGPCL